MTNASDSKSPARLELRIGQEAKALVQKAADLQGRTLTDFVIAAVLAEARRAIEQHQTLTLSLKDSNAFVEAILNPPKPNQALKSAAARYKQTMSI